MKYAPQPGQYVVIRHLTTREAVVSPIRRVLGWDDESETWVVEIPTLIVTEEIDDPNWANPTKVNVRAVRTRTDRWEIP